LGHIACKPWSLVNLNRRRNTHPDQKLLKHFFYHIREIEPEIFLMENVPPLATDGSYHWWLKWAERNQYSTSWRKISYGDFGASTSRRRLITVGVKNSQYGAWEFFKKFDLYKKPPETVESALSWLRNIPEGGYPDHTWPHFRTISQYEKYYQTRLIPKLRATD
jgi:site-specific DNA-cytosine methylase